MILVTGASGTNGSELIKLIEDYAHYRRGEAANVSNTFLEVTLS